MKYCILGGGGSFGIHTALYLLTQQSTNRVLSIGRNSLRPEPFSLNVGRDDSRFSYHAYHLTHELDLLMALLDNEKPDTIINFAAQGEGAVSWSSSWRFFETNCVGLTKLVEELRRRDYLHRFIQIGTSECYGSVTHPSKETDPIKPSSPYAASKVAFDWYLQSMFAVKGFPMNILRPSNAYGPGQLLHRVIPRAVISGLTSRKIPLQGGGRAEKSYIHSRDLARAIYLVAQAGSLGKIYNVGPTHAISIRSLLELIAEQLDIKFYDLCEIVEDRPGQDGRYWLDSSEIYNDVNWRPCIGLEHGIREIVNWGKHYLPILKDWPMDYHLRD